MRNGLYLTAFLCILVLTYNHAIGAENEFEYLFKAGQTGFIASHRVNLRSGPSIKSNKIHILPLGTTIKIIKSYSNNRRSS